MGRRNCSCHLTPMKKSSDLQGGFRIEMRIGIDESN